MPRSRSIAKLALLIALSATIQVVESVAASFGYDLINPDGERKSFILLEKRQAVALPLSASWGCIFEKLEPVSSSSKLVVESARLDCLVKSTEAMFSGLVTCVGSTPGEAYLTLHDKKAKFSLRLFCNL